MEVYGTTLNCEASRSFAKGTMSSNENEVPCCSALETRSPPIVLTMRWAMNRPSPVLPFTDCICRKALKQFRLFFDGDANALCIRDFKAHMPMLFMAARFHCHHDGAVVCELRRIGQ